ncbi:MAG: ankyrin repeat domain-containing protein, partial [Planctomycetota bacterium]
MNRCHHRPKNLLFSHFRRWTLLCGGCCFAVFSGCETNRTVNKPQPPAEQHAEVANPKEGEQKNSEFAEAEDPGRFQQLMRAATNGSVTELQKLVDAKLDLNQSDEEGITPLMIASFSGHSRAVRLLIDNGADVNSKNAVDRTALMM